MSKSKTSEDRQDPRPPALKLAEWVSMLLGLLLVAGVAGYLVVEAVREQAAFIPVQVNAYVDEAQQVDHGYVLPLEIVNRGHRTIHRFRGSVAWHAAGSDVQRREIEIDYIGERASQRAFIVMQQDPRSVDVQTEVHSYLLD